MDPTTAELFFMGTKCETSGFETFNAVQGMENLDAETTVERTQAILAWLASRDMIDLFLDNPSMYESDPRDCDPMGTDLIYADRLQPKDNPDDKWLPYDTTSWGRLMFKNRWAALRETEKGSAN